MEPIKTAVIYYSSTGVNHQLAKWAVEAAEGANVDVRFRRVEETVPQEIVEENPAWKQHFEETKDIEVAEVDDLDWAEVIIFSVPTRYGNLPSQVSAFIDSTGPLWQEGKLADKVVTGMTSAINTHGGQEETILNLYTTMYHWGAIVVAPGYTDESLFKAGGNPYGTSVSADMEGNINEDDIENIRKAVIHQTERAIKIGRKIYSKEAELETA